MTGTETLIIVQFVVAWVGWMVSHRRHGKERRGVPNGVRTPRGIGWWEDPGRDG